MPLFSSLRRAFLASSNNRITDKGPRPIQIDSFRYEPIPPCEVRTFPVRLSNTTSFLQAHPRGIQTRRWFALGVIAPDGVIYFSQHDGLWRSLVAHLTGGQGVVGSNPASPTKALATMHKRRRVNSATPLPDAAAAAARADHGGPLLLLPTEVRLTDLHPVTPRPVATHPLTVRRHLPFRGRVEFLDRCQRFAIPAKVFTGSPVRGCVRTHRGPRVFTRGIYAGARRIASSI